MNPLGIIGGILSFIFNWIVFAFLAFVGLIIYILGFYYYCDVFPTGTQSCQQQTQQYVSANKRRDVGDIEREHRQELQSAKAQYAREAAALKNQISHDQAVALTEYTKDGDKWKYDNYVMMSDIKLKDSLRALQTKYNETIYAPIDMAYEQKMENAGAKYNRDDAVVYKDLTKSQ